MSGRTLTASLVNESLNANLSFIIFIQLEFDSGTIHLHNGVGTFIWGSRTWNGVGDFGGIGIIEEGTEVSPYVLPLRLSGLDTTLANEALTQNYYLRPITVYMGATNSAGALVADPDEMWSGKFDTMDVTAGAQSVINVNCESDLAIFDKVNGKRYTDQALQEEFSGDLALQFISQMEDAQIIWRGKDNVNFNANTGPGRGAGGGNAGGSGTGRR